MTAKSDNREGNQNGWQSLFAQMLPEIEQRLRYAFRHFDRELREESTQDGIVHCLLAFVRLFQQGRVDSATASTLAWYAALQVKAGRQAGCRLNVREPLSRYAQRRKGFEVGPLQADSASQGHWIDLICEDKRASVADQVAARMDVRAWFRTLCRRTKSIATDLALGSTTGEVARKYRVSAGRISQMRRELEASWRQFQGEGTLARSR